MGDIVERLRVYRYYRKLDADWSPLMLHPKICDEAADEIERLRAEHDSIVLCRKCCNPDSACQCTHDSADSWMSVRETVEFMETEIERLLTKLDAANTRFHEMNTPTGRELELQYDVTRLRAALRPFAEFARHIPNGWPGQCRLRVDSYGVTYECLSYHPVIEATGKLLPTIGEWRAALKAIESDEASDE